MVSVPSIKLKIDTIINKLKIIAKSANIPNKPYFKIIKMITAKNPTISAFLPAFIESAPKLGPTDLSSIIFIGAGKEPALRSTAKSLADSGVKFPVMFPCPPVIGSLICGALITLLSRIIASLF